ncbi:MFS transporter [Dactylosporangium roseum]|uniref:MFS transporter n=1 Tax=Dactylosporangium roseum TaxID=47989 RepID=A0ABY5Z173_9ACTN|nr:MFS transporter [Dactylosporangium roseum]UWZ35771.1 MFS transporter [Dactylosporangium roseum]
MSDPDESANHPATIGETLANREYLAVFTASSLSWFGDNVARAAIIALVYMRTESPIASAAAFAISYLPWLGFGAVLAAVADRYSYRKIMIISDALRMVIMIGLAVFGGLPVFLLIGLLFVNALLSPPFDSARSALLPRIVQGERYITALTMQRSAAQIALIAGYAAGAALTAIDARYALLFNAATFATSALLIFLRVQERPPSLKVEQRTNLIRESIEGYSVVFRSPVMRAIALLVFCGVCFGVVPEGLAAAWSAELAGGPSPGYLGVIMVSAAAGFMIGSALVTWLVKPHQRIRLIRPVAIITPLALVPSLLHPNIVGVVAMTLISGAAMAGTLPATNGLFVQVLPPAYRARAFGVMQSGVQLIQGAAIVFTGWLASDHALAEVVGYFSMAGVVIMAVILTIWPTPATIADAIAANKVQIAAEEQARRAPETVDDFGEVTIDLGRVPLPARRSRPSPGPGVSQPAMLDPAERTVDLSERTAELGGLPPPPPSQPARHS